MNVAALLWQLTGSRLLRNVVVQVETTGRYTVETLELWRERGRQRHALARLDADRLLDIGRSPLEVEQECAKPVWRD